MIPHASAVHSLVSRDQAATDSENCRRSEPYQVKSCILEEPGRICVTQVADPRPGDRDVVIRVRAALTCGTDLKAYRRGHPKFPCPTPFGHEFSGEIVEAGKDVSAFDCGQAVMSANTGPCLTCFHCKRGQENLCESLMPSMVVGAFAEYLLIPERVLRSNVYAKPDALPFEQAALLEPLSSVCFGLAQIPKETLEGGTALIVGAGPIGLLWLVALRASGAGNVIVAARRPGRLAHASALGATDTACEGDDLDSLIAERSGGRGADIVVECTGLPEVWERVPGYARKGGTVILFGGCPSGTRASFDTYRIHYDGVQIVSPFHFRPRDVAESYRLLTRSDVDWSGFITSRAGLDDVPEIFASLGDDGGVKCAILPHGG
jgi:L-iditol 2-dehydrogenase